MQKYMYHKRKKERKRKNKKRCAEILDMTPNPLLTRRHRHAPWFFCTPPPPKKMETKQEKAPSF